MLAPHHAENPQLGDVRFAPQNFLNARVFVRRQSVLRRNLRRHLNFALYRLLHISFQ